MTTRLCRGLSPQSRHLILRVTPVEKLGGGQYFLRCRRPLVRFRWVADYISTAELAPESYPSKSGVRNGQEEIKAEQIGLLCAHLTLLPPLVTPELR